MMPLTPEARICDWPLRETFTISRGSQNSQPTIQVELRDDGGRLGRGEASGVDYADETPRTIIEQIEACRASIEADTCREVAQRLLPAGGARNALDCALWDLEFQRLGIDPYREIAFPLITAYTIGIRDLRSYEETAARIADYPLLKVKVGEDEPLDIVDAVRRGSPIAKLIADPNQGWSVELLMTLAPVLVDHDVVLLEQPIAVGDEHRLSGWKSPVPLCVDELVSTSDDLDAIGDEFQFVNVKLDKSGGLTGALRIVDKVKERGLQLMVGCMGRSSLAMAPALLIAAHAEFIDLDGLLLQAEDVEPSLLYQSGMIQRPPRGLLA